MGKMILEPPNISDIAMSKRDSLPKKATNSMMEGSRATSVSQSQSGSTVSGSVSLTKETVTTRETLVNSEEKTSKALDNSGVQMMVLPLIKHKDKVTFLFSSIIDVGV